MLPKSDFGQAWPKDHPFCRIEIPTGKNVERVEYEVSRNRDHSECVQAATLVFGDGSEMWVDLSAAVPGVSLTYQSAPEIPVAFKMTS